LAFVEVVDGRLGCYSVSYSVLSTVLTFNRQSGGWDGMTRLDD